MFFIVGPYPIRDFIRWEYHAYFGVKLGVKLGGRTWYARHAPNICVVRLKRRAV